MKKAIMLLLPALGLAALGFVPAKDGRPVGSDALVFAAEHRPRNVVPMGLVVLGVGVAGMAARRGKSF